MATHNTILVTGANGQLGKEFQALAALYPQYHFLFATRDVIAIEDAESVKKYFADNTIDYCVNCAAYTAVDKAETESDAAFLINATAVGNLAAVCASHKTQLIHISTDYVFDGTGKHPYKETDPTNPVSIYGQSKLQGEQLAVQNNPAVIIIRTSWVFSSFGNNFVKTMLRLMKERESVNVVDDQLGCPTYAADLATCIMEIIEKCSMLNVQYPIFNYCNEGVINWYQFALAIKEFAGSACAVNPIPSSQYPTPVKRPQYSALDTTKIKEALGITIPGWRESLEKCLALIK
ncbi:dTDP-4-dehydrorhamnose reductase [Ferruginibacter sp. SUN106]|uniref:dTDP-4-dehydrorhamnose reductase n=1 Tax=Ferruginibacter sp. SUN106 TaxID=2978348 RepID=UPI003D367E9A